MDDLLHEQIVHPGAGQLGLLEREPQVAQLGVARAGITSLHLRQQWEYDRLEAAAVRSTRLRVVIYICNTVASGISIAVTVVGVGFAVSPQTANLLLAGAAFEHAAATVVR